MPTVGPNYVVTATGIAGTWTNIANSQGNTPTTAATWVDATRSSTATWQGAAFGYTSASIPSGGVLNSISITVRHSESSATILSLTGQLYYSGTAVGTAHVITQSTTAVDNTWTVTDLGLYSNLANYQVRVVATRTNTTTSTTLSIFDCSVTLTYTVTGTDTYSTVIANDQPLAYWRLGDAGTTAADATGNGHPGTLAGGVTTGVAGAISGSADTAMTFNGSTGKISVASFPTTTAPWSFEFWFRVTAATAAYQMFIEYPDLNVLAGADVVVNPSTSNNAALQELSSNGNSVIDASSASRNFCDNKWHHAVVTSGASLLLYADGQQIGTGADNAQTLNGGTVTIGASGSRGFWLAGSLDEVAIYNYTLSAAQVAAHYTAGAPATAQIWQPPTIRVSQAVSRASNW